MERTQLKGRTMTGTLNQKFLEVVQRCGEATAFLVKKNGEWTRLSYNWAYDQVRRTAFGLKSLALEEGSRIGVLAENRPEWATTDFAAMVARYPVVPLYTTLVPSQIAYILNDAETRVVFVSTMDHLNTILKIRDQVPSLTKVVVFYPEHLDEDDFVISLDSLKALGGGSTPTDFEELAALAQPEDTATFVYTSGTTGEPKGVMLSHRNFMAEYDAVEPSIDAADGDIVISFLPLSHILQRVVDTFAVLYGMTIAYAESFETLGANLREVRPTHMVAVPRVYEKINSRILEGVQKGSQLKRMFFYWALEVGYRVVEARERGRVAGGLALRHAVADALVFRKIRAATGGRMRFYVSTGAPLAKELGEFFQAIGIDILEVYGMTEVTGAATVTMPDAIRFGSVGKPATGVELDVASDGEIRIRGDIVMLGYWNQPQATAEIVDDNGWIHTGDVGFVDDDGFVHITDRVKELIVTAGGKNVAPQPLENALKADPAIAQAMVIGDRRRFVSALIVPDAEDLTLWARANEIGGDLAALCTDDAVTARYRSIVESIMERFSRYERVRVFTLLPTEFTQEAGELTPTLKLKRRVLLEKYVVEIDSMYEGGGDTSF